MANKSAYNLVERPFVYGSTAFWLGKSTENEHSHRWTVYVRGVDNEDIGTYVKSVAFTLHASFHNPTRGKVPDFKALALK